MASRRSSSTRKRKRQTDESFRKTFLELRDSGVPDTGPKRPKDKRTVTLTPVVANSSTVSSVKVAQEGVNFSGKRGGKKRFSGKRGREEGTRGSGEGASRRKNTPRTQLRADIRDLIDSAIQQGDVTPAPPKTVLTPHVSTSPDLASQDDHISSEDEHSTQEMHPLSNSAGGENEIRTEKESLSDTYKTVLESPAIVDETPSQSRVLRSALKGVHSLSSLRKRSLAHTSHSVAFRECITVTEYSPVKYSHNTDSSLDSSTSSASPASPLYSRTTSTADVHEEPLLEPLEEDEEEEGGEEEEDDEEGSVDVRMKTPHLLPKPPQLSPKQTTFTSNSGRRPKKTANQVKPPVRKTSRSTVEDSSGPPKTLSRTLIKNLFMLSGKRRVTTDAVDLILKFSEIYLKQCSKDLATYAGHAGRKTMEVDDAVLLMKRQRFISESETFEYLVNTYLPLEYVEELLPCAVAGRKIVPTRLK